MSKLDGKSTPRLCDHLAAYEMGLLADQERISFETHLPECPECLDELYAMAPAALELRHNPGRYARTMRQTLAASAVTPLSKFSSFVSRLLNIRVLAPLAITTVVALFILNPWAGSGEFSELMDLRALPYTQIEVRAGGDGDAARDFSAGMDLYQKADYAGAATMLTKALDSAVLSVSVQDQGTLYAGVSFLLDLQTHQAISLLSASSASSLPPVAQKSLWYLAQAHLQNNDPAPALVSLELLLDSPVYAGQAQVLANRIKSILE